MVVYAFIPCTEPYASEVVHGKSRVEWSMIHASASRYVQRLKLIAREADPWDDLARKYNADIIVQPEPNGPLYDLLSAVAESDREFHFHILLYLDPKFTAREPDDIDSMIDNLRLRPSAPLSSNVGLFDASVFACDRLVFMNSWTKDAQIAPPEDLAKIEIARMSGINNDIDEHRDAAPLEMGDTPYREYAEKVLSETGYNQNAAMYNKGVENNLLPSDYLNSFVNHIALNLEVGLHGDTDVEEYALVKRKKGETKNFLVKRWTAHSARDISKAKGENLGPAMIIGSGASLNDALPLLKDFSGAIFCSTSHASSMVYHGRDPDYIVAYDINSSPDEMPIEGAWGQRKSTLITHPGINPMMVNFWEGPKLLFREMDTANFFMAKVLPAGYQNIVPSFMYLFSCSVAAEMSLAQYMGYSPLFMVGCDFTSGRFLKTTWKDGAWKTEEPRPAPIHPDITMGKELTCDNGERSYAMTIFYKRSVLCVWAIDHSQCLMTSPKSIITQMPQVDIRSVVAYQGKGFEKFYLTNEEIDDRAEGYLARVNQFLVRIGKGKRVVEAPEENWEVAIRQYMEGIRNAMMHNGQDVNELDIEANMVRFKAMKEKGNGKADSIANPEA